MPMPTLVMTTYSELQHQRAQLCLEGLNVLTHARQVG